MYGEYTFCSNEQKLNDYGTELNGKLFPRCMSPIVSSKAFACIAMCVRPK